MPPSPRLGSVAWAGIPRRPPLPGMTSTGRPLAELRRDPLTGAGVILAPGRGGRPHDVERGRDRPRDERDYDEDCPFCPGHEASSPTPTLIWPAGGPWQVRVVPNKYPLVAPPDGVLPAPRGGLLEATPAVGAHEVIVESPHHVRPIARMTREEVKLVLWAYRERLRALSRAPWVRYLVVFKNSGPTAGTSLGHPHSQLVALAARPDAVEQRRAIAREHRARTGRRLHEDVLAAELRTAERLVATTERFVAYCPFASAVPFAVDVCPRVAMPSFGDADDASLLELASLLRDVLQRVAHLLHDPDYNYVLHTGLVGDPEAADESWRLAIEPRVSTAAGFERGSGLGVNTTPPEEAAARLRGAEPPSRVRSVSRRDTERA